MTAKAKLETWAIAQTNVSLCAYGSRKADLDYFLFVPEKKFEVAPVFGPDAIWTGGDHGKIVIVGKEYFDIHVEALDPKPKNFVMIADMLRNSDLAPPVWVCDPHGFAVKFADHAEKNPRHRLNDDEIISLVRTAYINLLFCARKCESGLHYTRWHVARCLEFTLFELARQYNLRQGGKGKWKGRDLEAVLTPGQLEMVTIDLSLDLDRLRQVIISYPEKLKFWLCELKIKIPERLNNPWKQL